MLSAFDWSVDERILAEATAKEVANAWVVIDVEGFAASALHRLEVSAAAREVSSTDPGGTTREYDHPYPLGRSVT